MKTITKREYNAALKTIKKFELQKMRVRIASNLFGFLWWGKSDNEHSKWIKAKDINEACAKFLKCTPTLENVDYEVQNGYNYIDISDIKPINKYI